MTTTTTTIRLYLDPNVAGLAYDVRYDGDTYGQDSGSCGPDRSDIEDYGDYSDATHLVDLNAAVNALGPWVIDIDISGAGADGLLAEVTVAATDLPAACRALGGLNA